MFIRLVAAIMLAGSLGAVCGCHVSRLTPQNQAEGDLPNSNNENALVLHGTVYMQGPVSGASVLVFSTNPITLQTWYLAGPVQTDAAGGFSIEVPASETGPLLFVAYEGSYVHPLTHAPVTLPTLPLNIQPSAQGSSLTAYRVGVLEALWHVQEAREYVVSPFTSMVSRLSIYQMLHVPQGYTEEQFATVGAALGKSLGFMSTQGEGLDVRALPVLDVSQQRGSGIDSSVLQATAYMASLFYAAQQYGGTEGSVLEALQQDLSDAWWDGLAWDGFNTWKEIHHQDTRLPPHAWTQNLLNALDAFLQDTAHNTLGITVQETAQMRTALNTPQRTPVLEVAPAPWFEPVADVQWSEEGSVVDFGTPLLAEGYGVWGTPLWKITSHDPLLFSAENLVVSSANTLVLSPLEQAHGTAVFTAVLEVPFLPAHVPQEPAFEVVLRMKRTFVVTVP
jgi:hypothetical protein